MKNCPECDLLMDDGEEICGSCSAQAEALAATTFDHVRAGGAGSTVGPGATALLDPPAAPAQETEFEPEYRTPRPRPSAMAVVLFVVFIGGAGVLLVMGARAEGPLAETMVDVGVVEPPVVSVPRGWTTMSADQGGFRVTLPFGAEELGVDGRPTGGEGDTVAGYSVALGSGGQVEVVSSPSDVGDSQAALDQLIDGLVAQSGLGEETVRRELVTGDGRAADVVVVDDDAAVTTRLRFMLIDGRVYVLSTSGADIGAEALDATHARVVDSFETLD